MLSACPRRRSRHHHQATPFSSMSSLSLAPTRHWRCSSRARSGGESHHRAAGRDHQRPATEAANSSTLTLPCQTIPNCGRNWKRSRRRAGELDALSQDLAAWLAIWSGSEGDRPAGAADRRGRANLARRIGRDGDIERLRMLFDDLEKKDSLIEILNLAESGRACASSSVPRTSCFTLRILADRRSLPDSDDPSSARSVSSGRPGSTIPHRSMVDYTAQLMSRCRAERILLIDAAIDP